MDMKLELVPIPVADLDRAKAFYVEKLGFNADHDTRVSDTLRVVQLTPLGRLVRSSLGSACPKLTTCSLDRSRPCTWSSGTCARRAKCSLAVALRSSQVEEVGRGVKHVYFSDPDGNSWVFQELPWRSSEFNA